MGTTERNALAISKMFLLWCRICEEVEHNVEDVWECIPVREPTHLHLQCGYGSQRQVGISVSHTLPAR